jgi:hypothetical protein
MVLLTVAASLMLAACGNDVEEAQQEIGEVAVAYGESDGAEACQFMSSSALDQLGGESGCTRQFEDVPPAQFTVEDVQVNGERGTAKVRNEESDMVIDLAFVLEDDEWKLSEFPGLDQIQPPPPGGAGGEGATPEGGGTPDPEELELQLREGLQEGLEQQQEDGGGQ